MSSAGHQSSNIAGSDRFGSEGEDVGYIGSILLRYRDKASSTFEVDAT
jgi:hypothetical protein